MDSDRNQARPGGKGRPLGAPWMRLVSGAGALAAVLLAAQPASAQVVVGRVLTAVGDTAVPGAVVRLRPEGVGSTRSTRTGATGRFAAQATEAGDFVLEAESPGFAPTVSPVFELRPGEVVEVRLYLSRGAPSGAPMQVVAVARNQVHLHGEFTRRAGAAIDGWSLTREEIVRSGAEWTSELLWRIPGLATIHTQGFEHADRARRTCLPMVFLDGLRIGAGAVDAWITPNELEAIEVYTGASAPLEFPVPQPGCPLVLLWSRS
jgi:hypothetical protein